MPRDEQRERKTNRDASNQESKPEESRLRGLTTEPDVAPWTLVDPAQRDSRSAESRAGLHPLLIRHPAHAGQRKKPDNERTKESVGDDKRRERRYAECHDAPRGAERTVSGEQEPRRAQTVEAS